MYGQHVDDQQGTYMGQFGHEEGNLNRVFFHGKGIFQFKNGDIYEGDWSDGHFDGKGIFTYAKPKSPEDEVCFAQFKGTYKAGRRSEGTLIYANGDIFQGTFNEEGMKDCGVQKYSNGDEFAGDFKNGARWQGVMKFATGEEYSGEWQNGLFHGAGKIKYETGLEY